MFAEQLDATSCMCSGRLFEEAGLRHEMACWARVDVQKHCTCIFPHAEEPNDHQPDGLETGT